MKYTVKKKKETRKNHSTLMYKSTFFKYKKKILVYVALVTQVKIIFYKGIRK